MSEEQFIHSERKCSYQKLSLLVGVTLLFTIATFVLTLINMFTAPKAAVAPAPRAVAPKVQKEAVVISKQYDKGQSYDKAKATKKPMVVFFYTDWCGFCQRFAPTFHKVVTSKDVKKNFAVAYVNCDLPESRAAMQEYGVNAFPTVFVVKADGEKKQLSNPTFFAPEADKNLPKDILAVIGK